MDKSHFSQLKFYHEGSVKVVMVPGQKFLTQVGSGQPSLVRVWVLKISPKNHKFFKFFSFGSKKVSMGQVKKYPGQRRVGILFTAGQNILGLGRVRACLYVKDPAF